MKERGAERLYQMLPAIYRVRDAEQGEPLRRLLAVIERELQGLQDDVSGLYENWFIETCEEWVVPYIGDLLGVRGLHPGTPDSFSLRALVANTLAYRRRKGTAALLEEVARDSTGWRARAVESFQQLAVSAHVNHPRRDHPAVFSVRGVDRLQYVDGPFDPTHRTADVRHVQSGRGRHNLPHVALWLWRLAVLETEGASARALGSGLWSASEWSWQSGVPLFNRPRTETQITSLAAPQHVPGPLLRLPLYREVEALAAGEAPERAWFPLGADPVVGVRYLVGGVETEVHADWNLAICHLGDLPELPVTDFAPLRAWLAAHGRDVGLDPASGRLLFREGLDPDEVLVDIATATPGYVGGGAYISERGVALGDEPPTFLAVVTRERPPSNFADPSRNWVFSRLADALDSWSDHLALTDDARGIILFADSRTYDEGNLELLVPQGCRLSLISGAIPEEVTQQELGLTEEASLESVVLQISLGGVRPHLRAQLDARDPAGTPADLERGQLLLHGLHLEGALRLPDASLARLALAHVTFARPGGPALLLEGLGATDLCVNHSVILGLSVTGTGSVTVTSSVIDGGDDDDRALAAPEALVHLCACTVRGELVARTLNASDSLFTGTLAVTRRQEGCVRFSYLPPGSTTPRRFRCQPELELSASEAARLRPAFVSTELGAPAYFQLAAGTAPEILLGAEDGAEVGVWRHLRQPQRAANLRQSLVTYLRFGLEAGSFHAT